ncbi:MAG: DEAD/DEAH box helicase [Candidatus Wallbacteria bacterium]|nr:DEAD/DEAH box helicase [Candidatus Wallbacteria bacterium]
MTDLTKTFMDLGLSEPLLRAVDELGFTTPTPIQAAAIPVAMRGVDLIAQAQTGTGKTAAFGIPIIERIDPSNNVVQAVILTPTRELAAQVAGDVANLAKHRGVRIAAIFGGEPIRKQIQLLTRGVHIVVGTPGRVIDHLQRGTIRFGTVRYAVLDEADEMLDMGFIDDIRRILRSIPRSRQTMLFSATMPTPVLRLATSYMTEPEQINMSEFNLLVLSTEHRCYEVNADEAYAALTDLVDHESITRGLIFCNTRRETDELAARLKGDGYEALGLHADMSQEERSRAMSHFREGEIELLVATDVAARGIDVFDVSHVINFHVPLNPETYLHRIGRTGRAGKKGVAVTFIRDGEFHDVHRIQEGIDVWIEPWHLPDPADVAQARRARRIERRISAAPQEDVDAFVGEAAYLLDRFGAERVTAALLGMVWAQQELPAAAGPENSEKFPDTGASAGMVRLVVTISRRDIRASDLSRSAAGYSGMPRKEVGYIRLGDAESTLEVPERYAAAVLKNLDGGFIRGKKVHVRLGTPGGRRERPPRRYEEPRPPRQPLDARAHDVEPSLPGERTASEASGHPARFPVEAPSETGTPETGRFSPGTRSHAPAPAEVALASASGEPLAQPESAADSPRRPRRRRRRRPSGAPPHLSPGAPPSSEA